MKTEGVEIMVLCGIVLFLMLSLFIWNIVDDYNDTIVDVIKMQQGFCLKTIDKTNKEEL